MLKGDIYYIKDVIGVDNLTDLLYQNISMYVNTGKYLRTKIEDYVKEGIHTSNKRRLLLDYISHHLPKRNRWYTSTGILQGAEVIIIDAYTNGNLNDKVLKEYVPLTNGLHTFIKEVMTELTIEQQYLLESGIDREGEIITKSETALSTLSDLYDNVINIFLNGGDSPIMLYKKLFKDEIELRNTTVTKYINRLSIDLLRGINEDGNIRADYDKFIKNTNIVMCEINTLKLVREYFFNTYSPTLNSIQSKCDKNEFDSIIDVIKFDVNLNLNKVLMYDDRKRITIQFIHDVLVKQQIIK